MGGHAQNEPVLGVKAAGEHRVAEAVLQFVRVTGTRGVDVEVDRSDLHRLLASAGSNNVRGLQTLHVLHTRLDAGVRFQPVDSATACLHKADKVVQTTVDGH